MAESATGVHRNEAQTFSGVSCLVLTTRHPGKSQCLHFWWPVWQIWHPGTDSAQPFWDLAAYLQHFGGSCNTPRCIVVPCAHFMDGVASCWCYCFIYFAHFGAGLPGRPGVGTHVIEMLVLVYEISCFVVNVVLDFYRVGWPGQA